MNAVCYSLDHPRVQQARARFYENRRRYGRPYRNVKRASFESIYKLLCDFSLTLSDIARRLDIRLATLKPLYHRHFATLFGNQTAQERYRSIISKTQKARQQVCASRLPETEWTVQVAEKATKAGHQVEPFTTIQSGRKVHIHKLRVLISGNDCCVHPVRRAVFRARQHKQRYASVVLSRKCLQDSDVQLFPILINRLTPDTIVIPSARLLEKLFTDPAKDKVVLYIPFRRQKTARHDKNVRLCPWDYRNAWHLIPKNLASRE